VSERNAPLVTQAVEPPDEDRAIVMALTDIPVKADATLDGAAAREVFAAMMRKIKAQGAERANVLQAALKEAVRRGLPVADAVQIAAGHSFDAELHAAAAEGRKERPRPAPAPCELCDADVALIKAKIASGVPINISVVFPCTKRAVVMKGASTCWACCLGPIREIRPEECVDCAERTW
jgi:hypothetical protein